MSQSKNTFAPHGFVGDHVRTAVDAALKHFLLSEQSELEFPSSLTAEERAYIHDLVSKHGLCSKSRGKGTNRYVTVYKREKSTIVHADAQFQLSRSCRRAIYNCISKYPLTNQERELFAQTGRDRIGNSDLREINKGLGSLPSTEAQVPPPPNYNKAFQCFRQNLPIWSHRDEIIRTIISNQVCIIRGPTGSGKTTQVPQFILEHCRVSGKRCRIIVTEPRRIAVVNVCERVCLERNEKMGQNVGYQIRLESRISPMTALTFCTTGVLLRTLMSGDSSISNVTHIIMDEIHERDRFCDFLLIIVRDLLAKMRDLRLILLSATLCADIFSKYFQNCPVILVPGRMFPVEECYLEDILKQTGYMSNAMLNVKQKLSAMYEQKEHLQRWEASISNTDSKTEVENKPKNSFVEAIASDNNENQTENSEVEINVSEEMDNALEEAFLTGTENSMTRFLQLILTEKVSVDYQHSKTAMTSLMVAAARNFLDAVEELLLLGANTWIRASNGKTALDWANFLNHKEAAELIQSYTDLSVSSFDDYLIREKNSLSEKDQELLDIYQNSFNDENVDVDLLMTLLIQIHCTQPKGEILIFLPGYDDIVSVRERILAEDKKLSEHMKYVIYTLHSNMQTGEQRKVFKPIPRNIRKIMLSTNIAETSLTIDKVTYVIDSGKMKEKFYDSLTGVSGLRKVWISKSSADQRKGRAGRTQPGFCYRLFSAARYNAMEDESTPEFLRVPLQEFCLFSKLLAPPNTPIAKFLSKAVEPPPFLVIRSAVQHLKAIDALDAWEDLTELGVHLLNLPVEPRLGKVILWGYVLKCLDPILTIVCCLSYKDPFVLPVDPAQKRKLHLVKQKFGAGTFSDHMVLLRAFQGWQLARGNGWEKSFCEKNFISSATMEMITGTRSQLLAQLRGSGFVHSRGQNDLRNLNLNSENWAVVKAALCAGLYPNLARVDREKSVLRTKKECKVEFHPSSTLRELPKNVNSSVAQLRKKTVENLPTDWVMFEEMGRTGRYCHLRTCTLVSPITVAIFGGSSRLPWESIFEVEAYGSDRMLDPGSDSGAEENAERQKSTFKIDDWILFKVDTEAARLTFQLRQKLHALFIRYMKVPGISPIFPDEFVLKAVVGVLTAAEQSLKLTQPRGIGQRPRPCNVDHVRDGLFFNTSDNECDKTTVSARLDATVT